MNDSPGWAPPGSPSDPGGGRDGSDTDDASRTPPADRPPRNWSAQQPPPAGGPGWGSAPPPGPHGPPPHGWGPWNSWSQPPAAKPGVIPLRPLGVGEILDGAVSTARAHWRTALGIALGIAIVIQAASTVANGFLLRNNNDLAALQNNPSPTMDQALGAMTASLTSAGVVLLATLVGSVLATAMLTVVVSRAVLGRPVSIGDAWREARPQLLRMLGLTLLVMLITAGAVTVCVLPGALVLTTGPTAAGALLLFFGIVGGIVLGIWLWVRFCLSAPALMLERQGVFTSLKRSARLVRNNWWRIFGIQILAWLMVQVVSVIVQLPASVIASVVEGHGFQDFFSGPMEFSWTYLIIVAIGAVLALTVTLPFSAGITALLYVDQRIRREALDLELARAAGATGQGAPPPSPAGS